jgi:hypothetical protein
MRRLARSGWRTQYSTRLSLFRLFDAAQFEPNAGGLAAGSSDRIVYETDTGKLFYGSNVLPPAAGGSDFSRPGLR